MRADRARLLLGAAVLTWAAAMAAGATVATSPDSTALRFRFDVSFDGRPIGTHNFDIDHQGDVKRVRSRADFHVKLMFVSLYRYQHSADERWQGGCLRELASQTDDNGRRFDVRIDSTGRTLRVDRRTPHPASDLIDVDCAGTFAYWDLKQLERSALINSQTGSLTPVRLAFDGVDRVAGESADRYRLEPQGLDPILLWYRSSDQQWLQLETRSERGVLRYQLSAVDPSSDSLPAPGAAAR